TYRALDFSVTSGAGSGIYLKTTGNVGIGTTAPTAKLHVVGNLTVTGTAWTATPTISGLITATSGLTANGALTANAAFTLGDSGDLGSIATSDWGISTGGAMTGISGITNDGAYTQSGSSINYFSGNVGIGTTAPTYKLDVTGTGRITSTLYLPCLAASSALYTDGSSNLTTSIPSSGSLGYWQRNGTNLSPATITDNVGIGTTAPSSLLDVRGTATQLKLAYDASNYQTFTVLSDGALNIAQDGAAAAFAIKSGNVGIGTTSPGAKLTVIGTDNTNIGYIGSTDQGVGFTTAGATSLATMLGINAAFDTYRDLDIRVTSGAGSGIYLKTTGNVGIGTTGPGGNLEVHSAAGSNVTFYLSDGDVAHGMTDMVPTDVFAAWSRVNNTTGGASLTGVTDDGATNAFVFMGVLGNADPTDTVAAVVMRGAKKNGVYRQALGDSETILGVDNNGGSSLFTILGSGNVGIGTTAPSTKLHIAGDMRLTGALYDVNNGVGTSGQVLSSTVSGVDWVDITSVGIGGSGTTNYIPKFTASTTLGNSQLFDNSTFVGIGGTAPATNPRLYVNANSGNVGIGTTGPGAKLEVAGNGKQLLLTGGTLASNGTENWLRLTGTLPDSTPTARYDGAILNITGGTMAGVDRSIASLNVSLNAGYTGIRQSTAGLFSNGSAGTGASPFVVNNNSGNFSLIGMTSGTTSTKNYGVGGYATNAAYNMGVIGISEAGTGSVNIGVAGFGYQGTNRQIGGYFSTENAFPDFVGVIGSAALVARNGAETNAIFKAFDNNTEVFSIIDGGNVGIGDASPAYLLTVGSGDLFGVNSSGYALLPAGAVGTPSLSFTADTNTGLYSGGTDILRFATAGSDRVTIDASGNVGIGTTGPGYLLDVAGTASVNSLNINEAYTFPTADGTSNYVLTTNGSGAVSWSSVGAASISADSLDFSEFKDAMTLDASTDVAMAGYNFTFSGSGNLGIGTTAPAGTLDIGQAVTAASAGTYYTAKLSNSYTGTMASATPVTSIYSLYNRPNVGIGGTSPQLTNLFVNYTSGNIGIGTTSVVTNLYLNYVAAPTLNGGSSVTNTYAFVSEAGAGNVGIGTTAPTYKLDVTGTGRITSTLNLPSLAASSALYTDGSSNLTTSIPSSGSLGYWQRNGTNLAPATITDNVGIGTTGPNAGFDVVNTTNITANFRGGSGTGSVTQINVDQPLATFNAGYSFSMGVLGSTYTTSGPYVQNGAFFVSNNQLAGGLSVGATHASGALRFYTCGAAAANERVTITSSGNVGIGTPVRHTS
ncbi:MAG: hypothetical protein U0946_04655, partial [Patescibacteria group bacterium]|nr:hypothetical protein [Patescibacteria group bacterium]